MKIKKKILGKNIYLRSLSIKDITLTYLNWLQDKDINYYLETRHEEQTISKIKKFVRSCNHSNDIYLFGIFTNTNIHIGNIKLGPIKARHSLAAISLFIGNKEFWGQSNGTESIRILVNYSFKELGLNKLIASMYANNTNSTKAFKMVGFTEEGFRKQHYKLEDKYADILELGLLNEGYKN